MDLKKFNEWLDSDEGQIALEKSANEMIKSIEHENRWIEKFKSRYEDKLDYAIETLQAKYYSKAYTDREHKLNREPNERLLWLVWNYAQKYCKPCLESKYYNTFTAEAYYIGSYVISVMNGQGSVLCLEKIEIDETQRAIDYIYSTIDYGNNTSSNQNK